MYQYLSAVNEELIKLNETSQDILEVHVNDYSLHILIHSPLDQVVPLAVLEEDLEFTSYLRAFNDRYS